MEEANRALLILVSILINALDSAQKEIARLRDEIEDLEDVLKEE